MMQLVDDWLGNNESLSKLIWRFIRTDRTLSSSYNQKDPTYFMKRSPERYLRTAGVPQGGVLSGMLANLYLHDFDRWVVEELTQDTDLHYYRYADDFIIMTRSKSDATTLSTPVSLKLKEMHLKLNKDKTKPSVDISSGALEFIGFRFYDDRIGIRESTIQKFKDKIEEVISRQLEHSESEDHILYTFQQLVKLRLNYKIRGTPLRLCEVCGQPKEQVRSWMSFFAGSITDLNQIKNLDKWIRAKVNKALHAKQKDKPHKIRLKRKHWKQVKGTTLCAEYFRLRRLQKKKSVLCQCSIFSDELLEENM